MEVYTVFKGGLQKGLPSHLPVDSSVTSVYEFPAL